MAGLQVLEETFSAQGFHVLGFYSNDFGMQGGDVGTCTDTYHVTFPQFSIAHVVDPDGAGPEQVQPVWEWLAMQPGFTAPTWNFHKYLISRDGQLVGYFPQGTWPGDDPNDPNDSFDTNAIVVAIEAELAK